MSIFDTLTALANAIRAKTGGTATLTLEQMTQAVADMDANGIDTTDATVTAADLAEGVTAYAAGGKITGTLKEAVNVILSNPEMGLYLESNGNGLQFMAYPAESFGRKIVDADTKIITKVAAIELGDATEADVRAGKTFTSAAGLKVTGTMEV